MSIRVPYAMSFYDDQEIDAVLKVLKSGSTMAGKNVANLESSIAASFGHDYGIMCNSGSSALTLALAALNLPKDSEVITPCLNFGTAVSSIMLSNLKPVFVDCEIETLQIDIKKIKEKITKKTKALLIPNLIGNLPNWREIRKLANKFKLMVIEDSADTLGATINNKPSGRFSDISITSFYGSHIISCAGNGGMLVTNNKDILLRLYFFSRLIYLFFITDRVSCFHLIILDWQRSLFVQ